MTRRDAIERCLTEALTPTHLEVVDESGGHNVPAGAESHFRVVVASPAFEGERVIARHRRLNALLADQFAAGMHALALHPYTPEEWAARGDDAPSSPPCHGGDGSLTT